MNKQVPFARGLETARSIRTIEHLGKMISSLILWHIYLVFSMSTIFFIKSGTTACDNVSESWLERCTTFPFREPHRSEIIKISDD